MGDGVAVKLSRVGLALLQAHIQRFSLDESEVLTGLLGDGYEFVPGFRCRQFLDQIILRNNNTLYQRLA